MAAKPPRLRMVAGPNGSGKTTLLRYLADNLGLPLGYVLNPDDVERDLRQSGRHRLGPWGIKVDPEHVLAYLRSHVLLHGADTSSLQIEGDALVLSSSTPHSYLAAALCGFIRDAWVAQAASFTFETVMSGRDKVELLASAQRRGYRTYLYYISTETPVINQARVETRVRQGGHDVPLDKIASRYDRSLALLREAIANSDRAYLFDNSGQAHEWVAEFERGRLVRGAAELPAWVVRYALQSDAG